MSRKNKVDVKIAGKGYTLVGVESGDYIQKLATYIDKKQHEVIKSNPRLSTSMATILTSINVADEFFKSAQIATEAMQSNTASIAAIEKFKAEVAQLSREVSLLNEKNMSLVVENSKKEVEISELKNTIEKNSKVRFYSKNG